jgi:radical SAM superfamily enzyme YgiQ (UPF0313 family)
MKDQLFVQFVYDNYHKNAGSLILNNGFQNVHHLCKKVGDFFWACHFESEEEMAEQLLPIEAGKVFVSAYYHDHLMQSYFWAQRYPRIEFLVGGPAVRYGGYRGEGLPPNLSLSSGLAEEAIFGITGQSRRWGVELPEERLKGKEEVRFSYTLDRNCYWRQCIFCDGYTKGGDGILDNDLEQLSIPEAPIRKMVRLNIPSMPPKHFAGLLPKLPRRDDIAFDFFVRGSQETTPAAQRALEAGAAGVGPQPDHYRWVIGIEWPSDRMLNFMKKGCTTASLLQTLKLAAGYRIPVGMPFIFGWHNLTRRDVEDAKAFVRAVEELEGLQTSCVGFSLEVHPSAPLYREFSPAQLEPVRKKVFNNGECKVRLDPEQQELNREFREFFLESSLNTYSYDSALGNVQVG